MATEGRLTHFAGRWFFPDRMHVLLLDRIAALEKRLGIRSYTVIQLYAVAGEGNAWLAVVDAAGIGYQDQLVLTFASEDLARQCLGFTFEVEAS